jgi:apolipoprotein N-acyltransferase
MAEPGKLLRRGANWLQKAPLMRAFLWGLAAALALPPVHALPVLLFSVPAFLRLVGDAPNLRRLYATAWCYGFGFSLAGLYWITEPVLTEAATFWWLVPFAAPALAAVVACYTIIPALAVWKLKPGFGRLLVFAGAWVLSNLAQQFFYSGFPWNFWGGDWAMPGLLGDIFIQPAALAGVHGLTFATILLAGLPMFGRRGLSALLAALVLWAGYGWHRLQTPLTQSGTTLALLQPNFQEPPDYSRSALLANWQRLLAMSSAGLNAGANALIWPEAASPWLLDSDAGARQQLAAVTGTAPVIAGSMRVVGPTDFRNSLIVTAGPLPALAVYDKWKLVPFGEYMPKFLPVKIIPDMLGGGFTPGPGPETIKVDGLPSFAPLICYESIFSGQIVDETHRPAWLVNITDDAWFGDSAGPRQHFAAARLRAVEEGMPLVRDANSGISAVFDPFGHVVASLPLDSQGVLVAPLPNSLPPTLFSRLGLALPAILAVVAALGGYLIAHRK